MKKIKFILGIVSCTILLASCDPQANTEFLLSNQSGQNLQFILSSHMATEANWSVHPADSVASDSLSTQKHYTFSLANGTFATIMTHQKYGNPSKNFDFNYFLQGLDSLVIINGPTLKKNLSVESNWIDLSTNKRNRKFQFEITSTDIE